MYRIAVDRGEGWEYWCGKFYGGRYSGCWTNKENAHLYKTYQAAARIVREYLPAEDRITAIVTAAGE